MIGGIYGYKCLIDPRGFYKVINFWEKKSLHIQKSKIAIFHKIKKLKEIAYIK